MGVQESQRRRQSIIDTLFSREQSPEPDYVLNGQPVWVRVGLFDGYWADTLGINGQNGNGVDTIWPLAVIFDEHRDVIGTFPFPEEYMVQTSEYPERWVARAHLAVRLLDDMITKSKELPQGA